MIQILSWLLSFSFRTMSVGCMVASIQHVIKSAIAHNEPSAPSMLIYVFMCGACWTASNLLENKGLPE